MLTQLTIRNLGIIDEIYIEFCQNFNILTGETGAGKSILIDALRCLLGERLDASLIRDHKNPVFIEGVFEIKDKKLRSLPTIHEFLSPEDNQLIIQRFHSQSAGSKIKINGQSVTISQLKTLGNHLIDFHGPHDHQMLLSEDQHLGLLDSLVEFKNLKQEYTTIFSAYEHSCKKLRDLNTLAENRQRDLDLLSHQVKELASLKLSDDTYEELLVEQVKINNAAKLHEHIQNLLGVLDGQELSANTLLRRAFSPLKSLTQIDEKASSLLEQLSTIQEQTNDLISQLNDYAQTLNFDEQTAQAIHDQCDAYAEIKRKYGPHLHEAKRFYEEAIQKLDLIKNFEHEDLRLRDTIKAQEKELSVIAAKITKARLKAADNLKNTIEQELKELGILHVQFEVRFEKVAFNKEGQDKIVFYISPNAGEDLKPLSQIVSSGEAARVMLALKKALIAVDPIPVLIFDEIDAQIGGRLGTITGKKLKSLSSCRQVILITHLPQIASFADKHFKVIKSVTAGRTQTEVVVLENKNRIAEIAQMMSGHNATPIALSHAKDMLALAQKG